jgi:hypothetical protein
MTYRADVDALTARQVSLQTELGRKQRELAEVSGMLDEARRVHRAEDYFARAPDLWRRQRRQLLVGALVVALGSGVALGAAAASEADARRAAAAELHGRLVRIRDNRAVQAQSQRLQAELEALRALGLRPVPAADRGIALASPAHPRPSWRLGSTLPPGAPWDRVIRE